jgi:hypothetical protein
VSELQERHEKLVDMQARLSKDHQALICKLDETEQELAAARYRPPMTQTDVQTDHAEPEIVLVEQPPSQAMLSEIAESVRAELVHLHLPPPPLVACVTYLHACIFIVLRWGGILNSKEVAARLYRKTQGAHRLPGAQR